MSTHFNPNSLSFTGHVVFTVISFLQYLKFCLDYQIEVRGKENLPPKGGYVLVGNHISDRDPPAIGINVGRPICFMAKKELFDNPKFGWLIGMLGAISIDREHPEPSTFKAIKQVLKSGRPLLTFIEGTRSKHPGQLGPPHTGPAYLAKSNKVPIVPVSIVGSDQDQGKIIITYGKPMQPSDDLEHTTWEIMDRLSEMTGFKLPDGRPLA